MRRILFISMLLLFFYVSSFGMAFDNHRRGFIIGGLGGIAVNTLKDVREDVKGGDGTNIALHIDFRIGGGFKGDKFMLYFWYVMNWLYPLFMVRGVGDTDFVITGIEGLGVSYYFKPTSPSLYINAGIGLPLWDGLALGAGAMGGIGYEFTRHWSVECSVMWGNSISFDANYNNLAISLSIIGIAY